MESMTSILALLRTIPKTAATRHEVGPPDKKQRPKPESHAESVTSILGLPPTIPKRLEYGRPYTVNGEAFSLRLLCSMHRTLEAVAARRIVWVGSSGHAGAITLARSMPYTVSAVHRFGIERIQHWQ